MYTKFFDELKKEAYGLKYKNRFDKWERFFYTKQPTAPESVGWCEKI